MPNLDDARKGQHLVLVTGGRPDTAIPSPQIHRFLDRFHTDSPIDVLMHGAANGTDTWCGSWADTHDIPTIRVHANWNELGRTAGFIRNTHMVSYLKRWISVGGTGTALIFPGGNGTRHCANLIYAADIPYVLITHPRKGPS